MKFSYQAIIFDCDGVIVDTENISNQIMQDMLKELGLEVETKVIHEKFSGFTTESNLKTAATLLERPLPDSFLQVYKQRFKETIDRELKPIEGVTRVLEKIRKPIAMATNANRQEMNEKLAKIGLTERFSTRFCVEDVAKGKPAPDLYLRAAQELKISAQSCLVIEDSLAGIKAGAGAGMTVLAYSATMDSKAQKEAGATACFETMSELETLLDLH
ncbi:HAD family hydrolase [Marinomonas epiphytica]